MSAQLIDRAAHHGDKTRVAIKNGAVTLQRHTAFVHGAKEGDVRALGTRQVEEPCLAEQRIGSPRAQGGQRVLGIRKSGAKAGNFLVTPVQGRHLVKRYDGVHSLPPDSWRIDTAECDIGLSLYSGTHKR